MPPPCQASGTGGGRWQVAHLVRGRAGQLVGQLDARDVGTCRTMLRQQQGWQHPVAPVLIWVVHVHRLEHGGGLYHLADGPPAPRPAVPSVDACHQRIKHLDENGPSLELPAPQADAAVTMVGASAGSSGPPSTRAWDTA